MVLLDFFVKATEFFFGNGSLVHVGTLISVGDSWFLVIFVNEVQADWLVSRVVSSVNALPCAPVVSTFSIPLLMRQSNSKFRCAFLWLLSQFPATTPFLDPLMPFYLLSMLLQDHSLNFFLSAQHS